LVTTRHSATTGAVLDAIGRALGADHVFLLAADEQPPEPRRRGWLWRSKPHVLEVDVPGQPEGRRLIVEMVHEPTPTDRLVARLFGRLLSAPDSGPPKPTGDPRALVRAAASDPDTRPDAMLRALVGQLGADAGALALGEREPRTWTVGPGRTALRAAALEALAGGDGRVEVSGRLFIARRWTSGDVPAGGLVVEGDIERDALTGAVTILAAVLRREDTPDAAAVAEPGLADLRDAVSAFPVPALAVDGDGVLMAASPAAEHLFGITEFNLGEPAARASGLPTELVTPGTEVPSEVRIGDRFVEPFATSLAGGGRLIVFSDPSGEAELRRAQEELVAAMAHELRTPIAGMKAFLEVLKVSRDRLAPDRLAGMVGEGIREIANLERLVEDVLLTTRAATGGIAARPDDVQLRPIADNVVAQLKVRYPDRSFEVGGDGRAHADPGLLRHALWHLVDNAAKFGNDVRVAISIHGDRAEISVTDRGPGIFSGDLPNLFRPFQRLGRNTTSQHGGAGVGLYLVQQVLHAQGGEVRATSRLGHGSTFTMSLPVAG